MLYIKIMLEKNGNYPPSLFLNEWLTNVQQNDFGSYHTLMLNYR